MNAAPSPPLLRWLQQADALRNAERWAEALHCYEQARALRDDAVVAHNLALCHLALQHPPEAIAHARRALQRQPGLWQSALVLAKALILAQDKPGALDVLRTLHQRLPQNAEVRVELARLTLQLLCDPRQARALVQPLLGDPRHGADALITTLITQLYDRDGSASDLNAAFLDFGRTHMPAPQPTPPTALQPASQPAPPARSGGRTRSTRTAARLRVGLLSPQFCASPVYFFAFGALEQLASAVNLVVLRRGNKEDWATQRFRAIASEWNDVAALASAPLAKELERQNLDALIDLGGWMDPAALHALASKPVRRMLKWVGGQSVTTGLRSFDGFLTDRYQTPRGSDALYSEPLIRLRSGYVTYTPPPYMPSPIADDGSRRATVVGVIANPAKLSRAFLAELTTCLARWQGAETAPIVVRCIDQRYAHTPVRQRICDALPGVLLEFLTPSSHREYLEAVAQLDAVVDTWPYSGGLTTVEALSLGVPVYTKLGTLFCERHTLSHCRYAGLTLAQCRIDRLATLPHPQRTGHALLRAESARTRHADLAAELLQHLAGR
ncbi:O-linked N-acetylglucosamine transferase-like protein [Candidatus Symbiobacter mobilis]|uniref:O-linked N-acetylglucosamine transferase-like protein n=1 Tax=Candidatus Symbiobacter mobilis CR TaxID=946483 RepID=U5NAC3_9BURK|nr:O-linked N-acetylglucosamine transferase-like protein [Candidatus Symbiobacter mobilis]AGX88501.1 O-linked N-acetylglucosamine transferase-like protein [Candidatus Symbiobacter mobilis CR]